MNFYANITSLYARVLPGDEMMAQMKVFIIAHVPEELLQSWLQHVRDFDVAHAGCHFEIVADCPDMSLKDMLLHLSIDPSLTFTALIDRARKP